MRTISTDVIVRSDQPRKRNSVMGDLPPFDEEAWCLLCERAYKHTILVNEIIRRIKRHPLLIKWIYMIKDCKQQDSNNQETITGKKQGWLLEGLVEKLSRTLTKTLQLGQQSGRFYTSVRTRVEEIFTSWFAIHEKLIKKISDKRRWLETVENDAILAEASGFSQYEIEEKARQILDEIKNENESVNSSSKLVAVKTLFKKLEETEDVLCRHAIIHLIKNGGKVHKTTRKSRRNKRRKKPIQPLTLSEYLESKRIEIEGLEKQLLGQLPRERDLFPDQTYERHLESLTAMPNTDEIQFEPYFILFFSFLLLFFGSGNYVQFQWYLLKALVQQRIRLGIRLGNIHHYQVLIDSFGLYAVTEQKYLQLGQYLLQAIKAKAERVEADFYAWEESIAPKTNDFLRKPKSLPYPISFGYDDVQSWRMNDKGKIFFKLNGWGDLIFEVRCHRRQLPLIKTFLKDWQTINASEKKGQSSENEEKYSGSFMLLRSIELIWQPKKANESTDHQLCSHCEVFQRYPGKGFWDECKLVIHWTYDHAALTQQGLEKMRQKKLAPQLKKLVEKKEELEKKQNLLSKLEQETSEATRDQKQSKKIESLKKAVQELPEDIAKRQQKVDHLQSAKLFERPNRELYEGVPNIFVGVLLDLDKHLVVAVVDAMRRKILTLRKARGVSEEGYQLLQKYLQQRQQHSKQRQKDQKAHRPIHQTESNLGQQVERLFARDLVELAQEYRASVIVIPVTDGWRERLYSQLVARAKIKCNGCKTAMAKFTKAHGERLHQWDYNRLSAAISHCAEKNGIEVIPQQPVFEEDAFQEAMNLAFSAYDSLNSNKT